jgi:hypothetical protein
MVAWMRDFLRVWLLVSVVGLVGCPSGPAINSTTSSSSGGGGDAGDPGPCGVDCSKFPTPQCTVAVCNTGQVLGALNTCVVVPSDDGTACDDGQFCTMNDVCTKGACVGGTQNDCGIDPAPCSSVICYETSKSCNVTPSDDGTACTPTDLCQSNGVCQVGDCVGTPKDCSFSPLSECNKVTCDSTTGKCTGTPDLTQDGNPCVLTGNLCNVDKACMSGQCTGGSPMDCSALNSACQVGSCDSTTGLCGATAAAAGTSCLEGVQACYVGACDVKGDCVSSMAPDGSACNDHDSCTTTDTCTSGVCGGSPLAGCLLYLHEGFESCPDGWTLTGDWQCGTPSVVGPATAHSGNNCIATQIGGLYHNNQTYAACYANSPTIDLSKATTPWVSFWAWVDTEGGTFDGWNMSVSTDGGKTFPEVTTENPAYPLMVAGEPAWGGDLSMAGWQNYTANLTAYAGQSIILQFAFSSDAAGVYPGVYIDDVTVAEPPQIPLYITTPGPLLNAYAEQDYTAAITRIGGTSNVLWSINTGGTNDGWLTISSTGVLTGKPSAANVGPVSFTVHVEEQGFPSNYAEQTYSFEIKPDVYYTSFEGTCPNGWALTGDWQCGVPTNTTGPLTAYVGSQCISTGLTQDYSDNDTWVGTTATSPPITLPGVQQHSVSFRMWVDTEGSQYDGLNLEISTDGGMTYTVLASGTTPYTLTIATEPAWGGHEASLGWQLVQADLTPYTGMTILLRFGFQSDASDTYTGVFIDDFLIE